MSITDVSKFASEHLLIVSVGSLCGEFSFMWTTLSFLVLSCFEHCSPYPNQTCAILVVSGLYGCTIILNHVTYPCVWQTLPHQNHAEEIHLSKMSQSNF